MILGGWYDHVTPALGMIRMSQAMPNSFLYLDPHMGHSFLGKLKCFLQLNVAFLKGSSFEELHDLAYSPMCASFPDLNEKQ